MKCMPSEQAFLGLSPKDTHNFEDSKAIIIPFGLEASVSYGGGTAQGPQAMLDASHEVELFDESFWCEPFRNIGISTLPAPLINKGLPQAIEQIANLVEQVMSHYKFPFVFGGEHALTAGAIRPVAQKHPDLLLLHFDAHADLRDGYQGEHYSHASAIRRCLDDPKIELISFGIRNISAEEIPFLVANKQRITIYWAKDKKEWPLDEFIKKIIGRPIYLSFDLDSFDASLMPATGTPEPGGIFWDEAIEIIILAAKYANIVAADINELAPIKDFHSPNFLAAKLAYKILSYAFLDPK